MELIEHYPTYTRSGPPTFIVRLEEGTYRHIELDIRRVRFRHLTKQQLDYLLDQPVVAQVATWAGEQYHDGHGNRRAYLEAPWQNIRRSSELSFETYRELYAWFNQMDPAALILLTEL